MGLCGINVARMMSRIMLCWIVGGLVIGRAWGSPVPYQSEGLPLALVSDLSARLGPHPSRLQEGRLQEARLPLQRTPQDLEAIKKVAQILVMLGQQVIPAIIGQPQASPAPGDTAAAGEEIPNDPVNLDKLQLTS